MSAPRSPRTRAAAGFAAGSITEIFACMSSGSRPARRASAKAERTPMSAIRTLRKPWSAARRASSRAATTCSWPRAVGAKTPPAGARAAAEMSQAAFGRAKEADLDARGRGRGGHRVELGVGLEKDAAPLRDAVHPDVEPLGLLEHGLEAARPLGARDLDPVLRAVGKALRRIGQVVQVARRQPDRAQEVAGLAHPTSVLGSDQAPTRQKAELAPVLRDRPSGVACACSNSVSQRSSSDWSSSRAARWAVSSSRSPQSSASFRSSSATASSCAAIARLDLLELAGPPRLVPAPAVAFFVAFPTQSLRPELRRHRNSSSTGDSFGRSRPSRRRSSGSSRSRSRASVRRPRRAARGRGRRAAPSRGSSPAPPPAPRGSRGRGGSSARRGRGSSRPRRPPPRAPAGAVRRRRAPRPASRATPSRRTGTARAGSGPPAAGAPSSTGRSRAPSRARRARSRAARSTRGRRRDRAGRRPRPAPAGRGASRAAWSCPSRSGRPARRARRARSRARRRPAAACLPPRATAPRPRRPSRPLRGGFRNSKPSRASAA